MLVSATLPVARFPSWHTHPDVWLLLGGLALLYVWAARVTPPSRKQAITFGCEMSRTVRESPERRAGVVRALTEAELAKP